jgi:hypothetical protein
VFRDIAVGLIFIGLAIFVIVCLYGLANVLYVFGSVVLSAF